MKIKTYLIGLLAWASVSCNDYLSVQPSKTSSIVPSTTAHLEYLLNNYETFKQETNYAAIYSSDDYGLYTDIYNAMSSAYDLLEVKFALWDIENLPNESEDAFWTSEYAKIFIANMVLEYIPQVTGDEATKANLEAEAHLVRAYSLWELANTYCLPYSETNKNELGLPLKESTSFDEPTARGTLEATYAMIEADIEAALNIKTELTVQNNKKRIWRASLPAVYAFAARYYLFRNNYTEALNYANLALEKHNSLVDYNTEMHYSDTKGRYTINPGTPEEETVEILFPYTHDSSGADITIMLEWKEFYYLRTLSNPYWWFVPSKELMALYDQDYDLRWKYHYVKNYSYTRGMTDPAYEWPGYVFFDYDQIPSGPTVAEMLLTKAECQAREGNWQDALVTVNTLRAARMDNTAPADRINLNASSQQEAIAKILEERHREMPFNMRWFDIRRFNNNDDAGDDVTVTREFYPYSSSAILGNDAVKTYTLDKNSRRFAQPILESEIETSQGAIQQNTY